MEKQNVFKWKHYQPDIILLTVRWYLRYNLSFRDLVEMMEERGLSISHTTIMRWVHQYGPELDKRIRRHLKQTNDSWRVDETYIKVKGQWMYLYRAVDSEGNTIDFYLSKTRDQKAAKRFFKKALRSFHVSKPRVITVDKNPAYPIAIEQLKKEKKMPEGIQIRQVKYLNNIVEQDHRFIKKRVRSMLGFKSFRTATSILSGVEAMHMIKKEQLVLRDKSVQNQVNSSINYLESPHKKRFQLGIYMPFLNKSNLCTRTILFTVNPVNNITTSPTCNGPESPLCPSAFHADRWIFSHFS